MMVMKIRQQSRAYRASKTIGISSGTPGILGTPSTPGITSTPGISIARLVAASLILPIVFFLVLFGNQIGYAQPSCKFSDVETHWARPVIEEMTQMGVINGYGDGTFRPDRHVTREEAIKMICCAFPEALDSLNNSKSLVFKPDYPDIHDRWSTNYLIAVTGFVNGYSDLTFRPADPMIRLDAAVLLLKAKFLQDPVISKDGPESASLLFIPKPGDDSVERIRKSSEARALGTGDDWNDTINLYNAMAMLAEARIVRGYDGGKMGWGSTVTRAELCTLIKRVLEYNPPTSGTYVGLNLSSGRTVHAVKGRETDTSKDTSTDTSKDIPKDTNTPKDISNAVSELGSFYRDRYIDPYERAKAIYDAVSMNFAYDYSSYLSGEYKSQEYADVIRRGNGVCAGIARVYVAVARAAGLDAEVVSGWGVNPAISGPHAWVRLRIKDRAIECDPTWGMAGKSFFDNFDEYRATGDYDWLEGM